MRDEKILLCEREYNLIQFQMICSSREELQSQHEYSKSNYGRLKQGVIFSMSLPELY